MSIGATRQIGFTRHSLNEFPLALDWSAETLDRSTEKTTAFDGLSLVKHAFHPVATELETLLQKIPAYLPCETAVGRRMVDGLFASPGKMIRPALYLLSCKLVGYDGPHKYPIAAVSEFVHTASLLHDDVIDNSTMRRNKPTTHSIWGDEAAILLGDLIYARASEMMAETSNLAIVAAFAKAIRLMSESELLQLEHIFNFNIDESTYLRILHGKTAVLIGTACKCAGLLGGCTPEQLKGLEEFGFKIGIAFQLIDDALDFLGDDDVIGKKTCIDLQEGKVTLPLLLLKDLVTSDERDELERLYAKGMFSASEIARISYFVQKYGTAEKTLERARELTEVPLNMLRTYFPATESRNNLETLARFLALRSF